MEQAILLLHLAVVIFLIALVLLQRSEGGALGMGGGGGGVVTGRGAATALQKVTWYLTAGFLATSLTLTVLAQADRSSGSVLDNVSVEDALPGVGSQTGDEGGILDALTPPTIGGDDAPAADGLPTPPAE
jgi:preprotein translocase subunit SecG